MAEHDFFALQKKYKGFNAPLAVIEVNGDDIRQGKNRFQVSDIRVDLTSGYEASMAEFCIYGAYDIRSQQFLTDDGKLKKVIMLGSKVQIYMGYAASVTTVFVGVITAVAFQFQEEEIPCIRVTAMDVKGVMMAGNYSRQLKATTWSEAVKEILERTIYQKLRDSGVVRSIHVTDTPDEKKKGMAGSIGDEEGLGAFGASDLGSGEATDRTVEMVAESDYEFVVKAARRHNFEFFTECGHVYFRKAKSNRDILMEMGPGQGALNYVLSYDLTGLVENVVVRSINAGDGKVITANQKFSNKISSGNKAKPLLSGSQKVYLDSTVSSEEEAQERAGFLLEKMSYRYGCLECEMRGMPELLPGHFVKLCGLGADMDNTFYVNRVIHRMQKDGQYTALMWAVSAGRD